MNILIAGGAGFTGTNIAQFLTPRYPRYHVTVFDNLSSGKSENLAFLLNRENFTLTQGDITNAEQIAEVFAQQKPDLVINCTGTRTEENAVSTFNLGNYLLLEACRQAENSPRFIFVSSDAVYGDLDNNSTTEIEPKTESCLLRPKSVLAAAQAGADLMTAAYFTQAHLPVTVIRSSNLFGPHQDEENLMARFIRHAQKNEDIPVYNAGTHTRSWLFIDDFVELIDKIIHANRNKTEGKIFNASGTVEITILRTVELILTMLNKPKELITFKDDCPPYISRRNLDSSFAQKSFDWMPKTDINDGIKQTIQWYKLDK